MTRFTVATAFVALLGLAALQPAEAGQFSRQSSATGPQGGSVNRSAQCAGGSCTSTRSGTTAAGKSFGGSSTATCSGGSCTSQGSGTTPSGNSYSRSGASSCANGSCSSTATGTGPRGGSYNRSGSVSTTAPN